MAGFSSPRWGVLMLCAASALSACSDDPDPSTDAGVVVLPPAATAAPAAGTTPYPPSVLTATNGMREAAVLPDALDPVEETAQGSARDSDPYRLGQTVLDEAGGGAALVEAS